MPSQYLHSGEPLPLAPFLEAGAEDGNVTELNVFHNKLLDYLRRLTAKLSADIFEPPSSDAIQSFAVKLSAGFTLLASPDTVEFNNVIRSDAAFSYSTSTFKLTFLEAGFYLSLLDIYIGDTTYTVQLVDGDSTSLPYGQLTGAWGAGFGSMAHAVPVYMHVNQTLEVQVTGASGNEVEEEYARWTVIKLGAFLAGGSGEIDPCDFDIWQLCP